MKLIAKIGSVKIYRDSEWDEFVVKPSLREEEWYFTDDYQDAVDTATSIETKNIKGE